MRPLEVAEMEAAHHVDRQAHLLVDLDLVAGAHHRDLGVVVAQPALDHGIVLMRHHHGVTAPHLDGDGVAQLLLQIVGEARPGIVGIGVVQGELRRTLRRRVAVNGDAGAVGSALGHLDQHGREMVAQTLFELRILGVKADDAAHESVL
jgi:hypothetical protein